MQRFFYECKYKNGGIQGGHNLDEIDFRSDYLILSGIYKVIDYENDYIQKNWYIPIEFSKIEYLKITPMEEDEEEF